MYLVRGVGIFRDITGQRCCLKCREELAYAWVWSCVEVGRRSSIPGKRLLFCLSLGYKVVRLLSLEDTEKRPEARLLQSCGFAQIRADEQAIALLDAPLSGKPYPGCARASPGLASCCWSTADQRGCLCCLCTPWCWIFFFISLLLQTSWQEVNGLLAQQSLLPHQGEAAWPDVQNPLFEGAWGDGAADRDPLLTFAVVLAQAAL